MLLKTAVSQSGTNLAKQCHFEFWGIAVMHQRAGCISLLITANDLVNLFFIGLNDSLIDAQRFLNKKRYFGQAQSVSNLSHIRQRRVLSAIKKAEPLRLLAQRTLSNNTPFMASIL